MNLCFQLRTIVYYNHHRVAESGDDILPQEFLDICLTIISQ